MHFATNHCVDTVRCFCHGESNTIQNPKDRQEEEDDEEAATVNVTAIAAGEKRITLVLSGYYILNQINNMKFM